MKLIPLANTTLTAKVSDQDFSLVSRYQWHRIKGRYTFYAGSMVRGRRLKMHQLIKPGHKMLDHADGNGLNNWRSNIRPCTPAQNTQNSIKIPGKRSSDYRGVCWLRREQKWLAQICVNYKQTKLGYFSEQEAAAIAYNIAARKLFGRFARLNIISNDEKKEKSE